MTTKIGTMAAGALLLCAATALAGPTPQQQCDQARVSAWKNYVSCIETVLAKDAYCSPGCLPNFLSYEFAAFAKCRHRYFRNWTKFQTNGYLGTSSCIGSRFVDNGDGTVTDQLTALIWEKKTAAQGLHSEIGSYRWCSFGSAFPPPINCVNPANPPDGTAFTDFLATLNGDGGFAGANGWRLPTLVELQTILLDFACTGRPQTFACRCDAEPCIDGAFGPTNAGGHWSATSWIPDSGGAWLVGFSDASMVPDEKTDSVGVRAVRGGF
jgi:hypothetical protein